MLEVQSKRFDAGGLMDTLLPLMGGRDAVSPTLPPLVEGRERGFPPPYRLQCTLPP